MPNLPKITVVTVVYNDAVGLRRTSASVLAQDYQNLEYLIIDGASNDSTRDELAKLEGQPHVRIMSEADRGIYDAMNKGLRMATGEWLNFMNAGDCFYTRDVLSRVFSQEYPDDTVIIGGDIMAVWNQELKMHSRAAGADAYLGIGMPCCHQAAFVRRTQNLEHFYQWEKYPICADCAAFMSMCREGKGFHYVNETIAWFDTDGISSNRSYAATKEVEGIPHAWLEMLYAYRNQAISAIMRSLPASLAKQIQRYRLLRHGWQHLNPADIEALNH